MRTEDEIKTALKRLARESGETPGRGRFEKETGIKRHEWEKHWRNYTELCQAVGLPENRPTEKIDKGVLCEALFELAAELGHIPTRYDMIQKRSGDPLFPSRQTITKRLGIEVERAEKVYEWALKNDRDKGVAELFAELIHSKGNRSEDYTAKGQVYLEKSGSRYKIGMTSNPIRRRRDLAPQAPDPFERIHTIVTDDPSGLENYWKKRWTKQGKIYRDTTEWFTLTNADVRSFKRMRHFPN